MCPYYMLEHLLGIWPGVVYLGPQVVLCLIFWGTIQLISRVVVPTCNPTRNGGVFLFLTRRKMISNRGVVIISDMGVYWEADKGNSMLDLVGWVARRRQRGSAGKVEFRQMRGSNEIEAPHLARRSCPNKGQDTLALPKKNGWEEHP